MEERLLAERDERQTQWRSHLHTYISVNFGLFAMNMVMMVLFGKFIPWFIFPVLGWGMGLGIHTLNHRAWMADNHGRLRAAEAKLGIAPPPPVPQLTAGNPEPTALPNNNPWPALLADCNAAVERAKTLMAEVHPAATDALVNLDEGLETVATLSEGATRIQEVLDEMAMGGARDLRKQIEDVDRRISGTEDEGLKQAHLANRALLLSRQAKLEALKADQDRMLVKAQGFLLAVENLHLDAARLSGPEAPDVLSEPIHRLTEEVQILRKVDVELKQLNR